MKEKIWDTCPTSWERLHITLNELKATGATIFQILSDGFEGLLIVFFREFE